MGNPLKAPGNLTNPTSELGGSFSASLLAKVAWNQLAAAESAWSKTTGSTPEVG